MIFEINKIIKNIKFPKILLFKDLFYIYGINSIKVSKNINKFIIFFDKYDKDFNFKERKLIDHKFKESTLIWDIVKCNNSYVFILETKIYWQ